VLVLSRQLDEAVVLIGPDGVELGRIAVVSIRGDKVRLGFDFPKYIQVHREEVADRIGERILAGDEGMNQ